MPSRFLKDLAGKFERKESARMALSLRSYENRGFRIQYGYYGHPNYVRIDFWSGCGVPTKDQPEILNEFIKKIREIETLSGQSRELNWTWDIGEIKRGQFGWFMEMQVLVTDNVAE